MFLLLFCVFLLLGNWNWHLVLALSSLLSTLASLGGHWSHGHTGPLSRDLGDEGLVDVGNDTTTSDGGTDKGIKLLVSTDGKQQVTRRDTLHLKILASITSKLQDLSSQVLHDGRSVHGGGSTNTLLRVDASLQETVNTTDRELQTSTAGARLGGTLGSGSLSSLSSLSSLAAFTAFTSCYSNSQKKNMVST